MGRLMDLTGQAFERLTVIGEAPRHVTPGGQRIVMWRCVCSCGNPTTVSSQNLRERKVVSCGCYLRDSITRRRDAEMTGLRSGRLVAVRRVGVKHDVHMWECVCDCGETTVVRSTSLRKGTTKSCGCLNREAASSTNVRETVSYQQAHVRVRGVRGPAHEHLCVDCGTQADEWSYIGGDPAELTQEGGISDGFRYSASPLYYAPRCTSCHRQRDALLRRERRAA